MRHAQEILRSRRRKGRGGQEGRRRWRRRRLPRRRERVPHLRGTTVDMSTRQRKREQHEVLAAERAPPSVGGIRNRTFRIPKNRERPCEGCRKQNPRNSGFHLHPPGVAFWLAPFRRQRSHPANPAWHRASKSRLTAYSATKPPGRILFTPGASAWFSRGGFHRS
jgi:hypothetical protein